jgi:hypothetical protein
MLRINWSSILNLALLFSLVGCTPLSPDIPKTPTPQATKTPATFTPQPSQIPNPVTPAADIPDISTPTVTSTVDLPTPLSLEFNKTNGFGDGYVAHVLIEDVGQMKEEDILRLLVTQWLEHCKTEEAYPNVLIKDYTIGAIKPLEVHGYYTEPLFKAFVEFSIIPDQKQNSWLGGLIRVEEPWLHLRMRLGVFGNKYESPYYWLDFAGAAG